MYLLLLFAYRNRVLQMQSLFSSMSFYGTVRIDECLFICLLACPPIYLVCPHIRVNVCRPIVCERLSAFAWAWSSLFSPFLFFSFLCFVVVAGLFLRVPTRRLFLQNPPSWRTASPRRPLPLSAKRLTLLRRGDGLRIKRRRAPNPARSTPGYHTTATAEAFVRPTDT